jgi:hypothetical protein
MTPTKKKFALGAPSSQMYKEEADLLKAVTKWLEPQRRDGIMLIRICDRYAKGYSDLFINVRGQFVVAELKDDEGEASPHQKDFIRDMVKCGAIGGVCRTVKEVADLVEEAKRRRPDWT